MEGAKGSALEWALALLHAPAKRHALRQKPLPSGMEGLLGIAAGAMPEALAEAANTFNEPEARIREAARFYVREVLFFPQADAYRILGVAADASNATIKAHHRLLQHWLHPDRLHDEDDAIFAARVNVAWSRLRNAERRQAYDRFLQSEQPSVEPEGSGAIADVSTWIPDLELPRNPWRHRLPVLVLSAACMLLVVLVLRDTDSGQDRWQGVASESSRNGPAAGIAEISVPRHVAPAAPAVVVRQAAATVPPVERAIMDQTTLASPWPAMPLDETAPLTREGTREPDAAGQAPWGAAGATSPPPATKAPALVYVPTGSPPLAAARRVSSPPADVPPAPPPVTLSASDAQSLPSYARTRQAWAAGDQLLRFMADVGRPPPSIWTSPGIQSSADRLRQDMHGAGSMRFTDQQWQIGERSAVLTSAYVVQGNEVDAGRLTADLVWRENRWLVVGLSIERAP